jgi:hypothetical protein
MSKSKLLPPSVVEAVLAALLEGPRRNNPGHTFVVEGRRDAR